MKVSPSYFSKISISDKIFETTFNASKSLLSIFKFISNYKLYIINLCAVACAKE